MPGKENILTRNVYVFKDTIQSTCEKKTMHDSAKP